MRQLPKEPPVLGVAIPGEQGPGIVTRGVLRPQAGLERFELSRVAVPDDLAPFVAFYWTVRWDLARGETFSQEVLPFPCVSLACEDGSYRVHGPGTARFVATLSGSGFVTGARFTPAGFFAFSKLPMRELTDRVLLAAEVTGREPPAPPANPDEARDALTSYLRAHEPVQTESMALVDRLVECVQRDTSLVRADTLAAEAGVSVRSLHRLFERHVGVSSRWIVRRARVQEAAERAARSEHVDWAALAQELGYADQSHLIRDFRAQIGQTPSAYAKSE